MRSALARKPDDEEPDNGASGTGWLVARARNGDRQAFAQLVEAHYDFIFRTACKWCGKRSDAEDIAQEVCIKLAAALKTFDGRSAFKSWLYRVTLNAVRDHQRANARRGRNIDALTEVSDDSADPDQEASATMKELWAAVIELPDHAWFIGCQFHPELKSRPTRPHPLFAGFIGAALRRRQGKGTAVPQELAEAAR